MQPSNDLEDIFELSSVQTSEYDIVVNAAISSCHKAESQDLSSYDTDSSFASCLNSKLETSRFDATIDSTSSSDEYCYLFIGQSPSTMCHEELEKSLSSILDESHGSHC